MKNKKSSFIRPRLPQKTVEILRRKGGPHSSKKGARGYFRPRKKKELQELFK